MKPPRTAAFFDFDRTVFDGDAGLLFGRELYRIHRRRHRDDGAGTARWALRNVLYEAGTATLVGTSLVLRAGSAAGLVKRSRLVRLAYRRLQGFPIRDLRTLAADFFEEVLRHRLYPDAVAEMERHRGEGRRVVLVSTGPEILLGHAPRYLPIDDVVAVRLLEEDGRATGAVEGPLWGAEKADAVRDYAHAHGLSLPRSWAYSDHHSDLAFLGLVGHPVAVNPTGRLERAARTRGWPRVAWSLGGDATPAPLRARRD